MPKNKPETKPEGRQLSEALKKELYGYCEECGWYVKPCGYPHRCPNYITNLLT